MPFLFQGKFLIEKKGPFHGFLGYFRSGLSPSVVLSTSPEDPPTHWMQTFFPMDDVVMVEEGDEVLFKIKALPFKNTMFWEWGTGIYRNGTAVSLFDQSDLYISKSDLLVGRMDFKPVLTAKGEIFRRVLQLCDGKKSMEEISRLIWKEYPDNYGNIGEAFQEVIGILRPMVTAA